MELKIFICWWGCFCIRFDLLPYSLLQPPAPPAPPPPRRTSRTMSKPTASASSIGGRKPKYATHHEHQKSHLTTSHCNLLKYALFTIRAFLPRPSHLISSIRCRASAPQWHWWSGEQKAFSLVACRTWWIWATSIPAFFCMVYLSISVKISVPPLARLFLCRAASPKCSLVYVCSRAYHIHRCLVSSSQGT